MSYVSGVKAWQWEWDGSGECRLVDDNDDEKMTNPGTHAFEERLNVKGKLAWIAMSFSGFRQDNRFGRVCGSREKQTELRLAPELRYKWRLLRVGEHGQQTSPASRSQLGLSQPLFDSLHSQWLNPPTFPLSPVKSQRAYTSLKIMNQAPLAVLISKELLKIHLLRFPWRDQWLRLHFQCMGHGCDPCCLWTRIPCIPCGVTKKPHYIHS